MDRFETDCVADSGGVVHIDVGEPGRRVHVVVVDEVEREVVPLGTWLASLGDSDPDRRPFTPDMVNREEIHEKDWRSR